MIKAYSNYYSTFQNLNQLIKNIYIYITIVNECIHIHTGHGFKQTPLEKKDNRERLLTRAIKNELSVCLQRK